MTSETSSPLIYVDKLRESNGGWKWKYCCHLFSENSDDNSEALHAFAKKLGLKRTWFQNPTLFPHYDLNASKRELAIKHGAISVDIKKTRRTDRVG